MDFVILARLSPRVTAGTTPIARLGPSLFPAEFKYEGDLVEKGQLVGRIIICSCESQPVLERILFDPPLFSSEFETVQIFRSGPERSLMLFAR
jgi:hypothetical protein